MELTLTQYTEPLTIKAKNASGEVATLDLTLHFSDGVVTKSKEMAKAVIDAANDVKGDDTEKASKALADALAPCIDLYAGEGATAKLVEFFGCTDPADCVSGLVEIWKALSSEVSAHAGKSHVEAVSRYLDANA